MSTHAHRPVARVPWLRPMVAAAIVGHGLIHLMGFLASWEIAEVEGLTGSPSLLLDDLALDHPAVRAFGLLWLVALVGFAGSAIGLISRARWARLLLAASSAISMIVCVMWWSEAWIGAVISGAVYLIVQSRPDLVDDFVGS